MSSQGQVTIRSWHTVLPTGMHHPLANRSIMVDVHYTASAAQSSTEPTSNSALSPHGPLPSQDLNGEHGMGSNNQTELSHYKWLYSQAHEDLGKLNSQAKRRSMQTVPPAICAD